MPDPMEVRKGCAFAERCKYAEEKCKNTHPELKEITSGHKVRCFYPDNVKGGVKI